MSPAPQGPGRVSLCPMLCSGDATCPLGPAVQCHRRLLARRGSAPVLPWCLNLRPCRKGAHGLQAGAVAACSGCSALCLSPKLAGMRWDRGAGAGLSTAKLELLPSAPIACLSLSGVLCCTRTSIPEPTSALHPPAPPCCCPAWLLHPGEPFGERCPQGWFCQAHPVPAPCQAGHGAVSAPLGPLQPRHLLDGPALLPVAAATPALGALGRGASPCAPWCSLVRVSGSLPALPGAASLAPCTGVSSPCWLGRLGSLFAFSCVAAVG